MGCICLDLPPIRGALLVDSRRRSCIRSTRLFLFLFMDRRLCLARLYGKYLVHCKTY
jgi:hypothetical protein